MLSFEDVATRATSLSFTALTPMDQEFNVRGITNTRLDSPTADQSIGIFVDDVYVGRSGLFNFDLFDIDRVEVVRGPQGVLLGRNVVGGAISIYSATPKEVYGGHLTASYGNYNEKLVNGHITGPISDSVNGRFAFQVRQRDGFNEDVAHDVDLDNVDSVQMRGQLKWQPDGADYSARLIVDYTRDKANGFHSVVVDGPAAGAGPWSTARAQVNLLRPGGLSIRQSLPDWNTYKGDAGRQPAEAEPHRLWHHPEPRKGVRGRRDADQHHRLSARVAASTATIRPASDRATPTISSCRCCSAHRCASWSGSNNISQEVRLVSPEKPDSGFDYIIGAYGQRDHVKKDDTISFEIRVPVISTLNGESAWRNNGQDALLRLVRPARISLLAEIPGRRRSALYA